MRKRPQQRECRSSGRCYGSICLPTAAPIGRTRDATRGSWRGDSWLVTCFSGRVNPNLCHVGKRPTTRGLSVQSQPDTEATVEPTMGDVASLICLTTIAWQPPRVTWVFGNVVVRLIQVAATTIEVYGPSATSHRPAGRQPAQCPSQKPFAGRTACGCRRVVLVQLPRDRHEPRATWHPPNLVHHDHQCKFFRVW